MADDTALEAIRTALVGHNAKPFLVADAQTGRPVNWYDSEDHAFQAARFSSKQGKAHVVYRAIGVIEPVTGNKALITHERVPPRADAALVR